MLTRFGLLGIFWLNMVAGVESPAGEKVIRILPLGDSITQGGRRGRAEYTYRWPLFKLLVDAGVKFDFIGSCDTGLHRDFKWPDAYKGIPFDRDHEGVYGIRTAKAWARLPEAATKWPAPPDIVLIHLGTNDQKARDLEKEFKEPMRKIIRFLREQNPHVVILLGQLMFNDSPGAFRIMACISELRKELDTKASPVRVVLHYQGWHERPTDPEADTFDWAHPNPRGQEKMARRWFEAMKPWLHNRE